MSTEGLSHEFPDPAPFLNAGIPGPFDEDEPLGARGAMRRLIQLGYDAETARIAVEIATAIESQLHVPGYHTLKNHQVTCQDGTYHVRSLRLARVAADGLSVTGILDAIETVDAHLDRDVEPAYREQPLAQDWARITKVCEEAGEVWRAHSKMTGENPRKRALRGPGTREDLLEELGDTASAALCAIQHITKDRDATWAVFCAALAKALSRVPEASARLDAQP